MHREAIIHNKVTLKKYTMNNNIIIKNKAIIKNRIIHSFIIGFMLVMGVLKSQPVDPNDDCKKPASCPTKEFPYMFCELQNGGPQAKIVVKCSSDPNAPGLKPVKRKLPICVILNRASVPPGLDADKVQADINQVMKEWNCLCDKQDMPPDPACCTEIVFSSNKADFGKNLSDAEFRQKLATQEYNVGRVDIPGLQSCDEFACTNFGERFKMYVNKIQSWYTGDKQTKAGAYSLAEVIQHELGHWMGLEHFDGHPTPGTPADEDLAKPCNGTGKGIMDANAGRAADRVKLSDDDKCMFMKLYCQSGIGAVNESGCGCSGMKKIYPNPTKGKIVVSFKGELGKPTEIELYNAKGEYVATLLEQASGIVGETELEYNAEHLPSGEYYCKISVGKKEGTQKVIINH